MTGPFGGGVARRVTSLGARRESPHPGFSQAGMPALNAVVGSWGVSSSSWSASASWSDELGLAEGSSGVINPKA